MAHAGKVVGKGNITLSVEPPGPINLSRLFANLSFEETIPEILMISQATSSSKILLACIQQSIDIGIDSFPLCIIIAELLHERKASFPHRRNRGERKIRNIV